MNKRYVTLKKIANYAGVSIATASIVLNNIGDKRISDETSLRVMAAAKELNYRPDINAQMLKGKASSVVGLVIPSLLNHFYPEVTKGVTDRANELGYNVVLFDTNDDIKKEQFSFNTLIAMRTAGIMIAGIYKPDEQEQEIFCKAHEIGIPVVQVDRYSKECSFPSVSINNYSAAFEMTEQLIHDGHQKIALIMPRYSNYPMTERKRGFVEAMCNNNLTISDNTIFYINPVDFSDKNLCVTNLLASKQHFTAVLNACGDYATAELFQVFRKMGVNIPKDISIASFDGIYLGQIISPSLTTVKQPIYEIGITAMDMLYNQIIDKEPDQINLQLPHELLIRESTQKI